MLERLLHRNHDDGRQVLAVDGEAAPQRRISTYMGVPLTR
jgi:hypothetical protein